MKYCLDTNTCIYFIKGMFPSLREKLIATSPADIFIPSLVLGELLYGAQKSNSSKKALETVERLIAPLTIVPFDEAASRQYALIRARLEKVGKPVGPNDLIIAATAMAIGAVLVTNNLSEFKRVSRLKVENWAVR